MHIKQDFKTFPFAELYYTYEAAAKAAVEGAKQHAKQLHHERLQRLEQYHNQHSEAPSEVALDSQPPELDLVSIRRRYGQRAVVQEWMPRYNLSTMLLAQMPNIMLWLANKPLDLKRATVEGQLDPKLMLQQLFDFKDQWQRGLYLFLMLDSRSSWIPSQYKAPGNQYCALVPLILCALKLHHKVGYNRWSRRGLGLVVNKQLCDAMLWVPPEEFSREQLLAARARGLTFQTGPSAGKQRNPVNTYKLWATKGECLEGAPELAAVMLSQIWCAHPNNRHHRMVLDPQLWDVMPPPLVSTSVLPEPTYTTPKTPSETTDTPW